MFEWSHVQMFNIQNITDIFDYTNIIIQLSKNIKKVPPVGSTYFS